MMAARKPTTEETQVFKGTYEVHKDGKELPVANDKKSFFLNIALIGDMSSGKSTLLNSILGEIVAQTGYDRSTTTVQIYCENTIDNNHDYKEALNHSKTANKKHKQDQDERRSIAEETSRFPKISIFNNRDKSKRNVNETNVKLHDIPNMMLK